MCGRISLKTHPRVIAALFGVNIPFDVTPRYNIAPTQRTLIIRNDHAQRRAALARWGFIPSWRKSGQKGPEPINARSESAGTSRLFASALRSRRCIVPASGFFEWQALSNQRTKRPFHVEPAGSECFALAGLWSHWQPQDAEPVESFTILTCAPNAVMQPIHDRMPVILPTDLFDAWLDPSIDDVTTVAAMLQPAPPESIVAHAVSTLVNNPKNDDERCIRPAPAPDEGLNFAP